MPCHRLIFFVGGELDGQLRHADHGSAAAFLGQYRSTDFVVDRAEGRAEVYEHHASDRGYFPQ